MKKIVFILFTQVLSSCNNNFFNTQKNSDEYMKIITINESRLDIMIANYKFQWDNEYGQIIKNSDFDTIMANFPELKLRIAEEIANSEETNAIICDSIKLKKGDIAFILIDNIASLPYVKLFGLEMDVLIINCKYPDGFFDQLDYQRPIIAKNVEEYLNGL